MTILLIAIILFVLALGIWLFLFNPQASNPLQTTNTESVFRFPKSSHQSNVVKVRIKGRFSRKVIRFNMRRIKGYVWGSLGVSAVSKAIKKGYRVILSRKVRKFYSKHYNIPFVVYRGN